VKTLIRVLGVALISYVGIMGVMGLQYLFDRGDLRKADLVVSQFKPEGSDKTLKELMAGRLGVAETGLSCLAVLLSRYEGRVEVDCRLATADDHNAVGREEFRFEVDVVAAQIRALNDVTKALVGGERK
jgi:hypothetical protein